MSYDIRMVNIQGEVCKLKEPHYYKGGTYIIGGNDLAEHNITYNYGYFYKEVLGDEGIRFLYGKTGKECLLHINKAIEKLGIDKTNNYWEATQGNAGNALLALKFFCEQFPAGIIEGD